MSVRTPVPATQREIVYVESSPVTGFMPEPLAGRVFRLLKPNVCTVTDQELDVLWLDVLSWVTDLKTKLDAAEASWTV